MATNPEKRVRRPIPVTILAILRLLTAAAYGLIVVALLVDRPSTLAVWFGFQRLAQGSLGPVAETLLIAGLAFLAIASFVAGIWLLRMRQVGWTLTMLLAGFSLATQILFWWNQGAVNSISLAAEVVTVFYLNQRTVREVFGITRPRGGARDLGAAPG